MQLSALLHQVDTLLGQKDDLRLKSLLLGRRPQELAHVIDTLDHGKRKTFTTLPPELQAIVHAERTRMKRVDINWLEQNFIADPTTT